MRIKPYLIFALVFLSLAFSNVAFSQSDSFITTEVKAELIDETSLEGTEIKVTSLRGIVKLSGTIDTDDQAATATELAQSVEGVKDVDTSTLLIGGKHPPSTDAMITARVKGTLIQQHVFGDDDFSDLDLSITTKNGIVTVIGTVDTTKQAYILRMIVQTIPGVIAVRTNIKTSQIKNLMPKEDV